MSKAIKPKKGVAKKVVSRKAAPKKAAPKKAAGKKGVGIKYADKSGGQPELVPIFGELCKLLSVYEKGSIKLRGGKEGQIAMVSEKPVEIAGSIRKELWFAAALIQKGYVGLYFMPVHSKEEQAAVFEPALLKCLKGKGCFHIKVNDPVLFKQIKTSLKAGYQLYKERGWIS
jgi:hypothetical protein